MSSSRSDDVTNSVCLSVCSHSSSLVYLMPHMCLKVVLRVLDNFQGCSKSVPFPRMFQVCFTGVLMMFHGCSKSVIFSSVFLESVVMFRLRAKYYIFTGYV